MRPRELVVSGFRSYEAETRFCWDDRSLVGIVGPIGSGKSSILDEKQIRFSAFKAQKETEGTICSRSRCQRYQ